MTSLSAHQKNPNGMPSFIGEPLYTLLPDEGWVLMESASGENDLVYAYASNGSTTELTYNESTVPPTAAITMKNISNGDYAAIEDININVKGYAIGVDMVSADQAEVWEKCRELRENK